MTETTNPNLSPDPEKVETRGESVRSWFIAFGLSILVLIAFTCSSHLDDFISWMKRDRIRRGLELSAPIDFPIDGYSVPMSITITQGENQSSEEVIRDMEETIRAINLRRSSNK